MNLLSRVAIATIAMLMLNGPVAAEAAVPAEERMRTAAVPGKYAGHLYGEGDRPSTGWGIAFQVRRNAGRTTIKGWGRSVVFYCYEGPKVTPQQIQFFVPRVTVNRRGKAVKKWRTGQGVEGVIRLKFEGRKVTGTLEYQAANCYLLHNAIKMARKR